MGCFGLHHQAIVRSIRPDQAELLEGASPVSSVHATTVFSPRHLHLFDMSSSTRWLCAFVTLLVTASFSIASTIPAFDPVAPSLTASNFTTAIDNGMWFVEFYSPYCGHCKKFAPVFHDLAESNQHLEDSSNFHIARVNCIAQGDLCQRENIAGYPSLHLYRQGKYIESFEGDRSYEELDAYIQARAADHRKLIASYGPMHRSRSH